MKNTVMRMIAVAITLIAVFTNAADLLAQTAASPFTTGFRYDGMGRVTGTIFPDPDGSIGTIKFGAVRTTYDTAGRVQKVEKGELTAWQPETVTPSSWANFNIFQTLETSYDTGGLKASDATSSSADIATITHYSYDSANRLVCTAVRMDPAAWNSQTDPCAPQLNGTYGPDRITKNSYNGFAELSEIRRGVGTSLEQPYARYTYTLNGKQKTIVDAKGNRTELFYDVFDRQIALAFPQKANGLQTATCDLSGVSEVNGIAGPTENRNPSDDCEKYAYDRAGNRAKLMKRGGAVIRYDYDPLNRMVLKDVPSGADTYYGYTLQGLLFYARFGSSSGSGVTNTYDGLNRLSSSSNNFGGTPLHLGYDYDADGNRTRLTYPDYNGSNDRYINFVYDGLNRMTRIRDSTNATLTTFSYNNRGERDCWFANINNDCSISNNNKTDYNYDPISRLTSISHDISGTAQDVTYCFGHIVVNCLASYNPANQVTARSISNDLYAVRGQYNANRNYVTNGINQYTTAGGTNPDYDSNGNLTFADSTTYVYDSENRLITASGAASATLTYDSMGRLNTIVSGSTTRFLYDGDELVAEYNASGVMLRRYVHGPNTDEPVLWYEGADLTTRRVMRADHQGSIVSVATSVGNNLGINSYDEWGNPASSNLGRFAYTGQILIPELKLYYYKARIYAPRFGRFMQTDPVGYDDQINLYAYSRNDPLNMVDPNGGTALAVVSGARWAWRVYKFSGNIGRASRETIKEISTDWHALDRDANTSVLNQAKAATDLVVGTNLYNPSEIYDSDRTGKIGNSNPGGVHVGDNEIGDAIKELDRSIERRKSENDRFSRGNPNGGPEDRRLNQRYRDHMERISREESLRDALKERARRLGH